MDNEYTIKIVFLINVVMGMTAERLMRLPIKVFMSPEEWEDPEVPELMPFLSGIKIASVFSWKAYKQPRLATKLLRIIEMTSNALSSFREEHFEKSVITVWSRDPVIQHHWSRSLLCLNHNDANILLAHYCSPEPTEEGDAAEDDEEGLEGSGGRRQQVAVGTSLGGSLS